MKKFIVIGNPIKHSLSPLVHNYWFEQNMIKAAYEKILVEEKELDDVIQNIRQEKITGANVTVPFKQKIIPLLDELSEVALKTNSVNTVYKKNNKVIGDNTDVFGFYNSLVRSGAGALPQAEWRTPFERRSSMTPMRCSRVAVVPWQVVPIEIGAGRAQVLVVGGDGEAEGLQNGEGPPGIPRQ